MKKHLIWSNWDLDLKDWEDYFEENDLSDLDEYEKYRCIEEMNNEYLYDERYAFKEIDKTLPFMTNDYYVGYKILAIASLGLWDGRRTAYRFFDSLEEVLSSECDYCEWYCDSQLRFKGAHHDGYNYYTYVLFKGDSDECYNTEGAQKFLDDLYYGNPISKSRWYRYTRSLVPYIKEYYGW
jgi:hypothetical protein